LENIRKGEKDREELCYPWRRPRLLQLCTPEQLVIHSKNTVPLGDICHIYLQFCPKQQRKINRTVLTELPCGLPMEYSQFTYTKFTSHQDNAQHNHVTINLLVYFSELFNIAQLTVHIR